MDKNREGAYRILLGIEKDGDYSNLSIKEYLSKNKVPSPDLVRRLVYGVLEKEISIDYYLGFFLTKGISKLKPEVLTILRLGAYQLEYMDSIPDYAAISSSVELGKKHANGLSGLINGVLRNWQRRKKDIMIPDREKEIGKHLSVKYSIDEGIVEILLNQRGESSTETILKGIEDSIDNRPITLRVKKELDLEELIKEFEKYGYCAAKSKLSGRVLKLTSKNDDKLNHPSPTDESSGDNHNATYGLSIKRDITETTPYISGDVSIQSEESCWIADICNPEPGDRVLDLCAAPGGKTLAMAEMMGKEGEIIACDIYKHRLDLIDINANRLGIDIIKTLEVDSSNIDELERKIGDYLPPEKEVESDSQKKVSRAFDVVLVDAPCSGLGVVGKKPEIRKRIPDTEYLIGIQRKILDNGARFLAPNGRLIYSTCTIDKRENEEIIKAFLDDHACFSLDFEKELLPGIDNQDGFYVAVLKKTTNDTN